MASHGGARGVLTGTLLAWALLLAAPVALLGGVTDVDATPAPPQPLQSPSAELASILRMAGIRAEEAAPQREAAVPQLTPVASTTERGDGGQAGFSLSGCKRDKAETSPAPRPHALWGRRDRLLAALRGQPLTVDVTPQQCQWLTDTVDNSMRCLLHEEMQPIGDHNKFPRIWSAHRCLCSATVTLLPHAALCVCTSHASGADELFGFVRCVRGMDRRVALTSAV